MTGGRNSQNHFESKIVPRLNVRELCVWLNLKLISVLDKRGGGSPRPKYDAEVKPNMDARN
jgi:hypothetical protein